MIRVVAAIIERYGRILICRRQPGKIFAGKWEFPGGKMRPSETPRQALARELREELNAAANVGDLLHVVRHRYAEMNAPVQISFFSATIADEPRNLAFERIVWVTRPQLPRYDFLAADRQLISRLVRGEIEMNTARKQTHASSRSLRPSSQTRARLGLQSGGTKF